MWHGVQGGESGFATPDPTDTNLVWSTASGSGSRGGIIVRFDLRSKTGANVEVWPQSTGGHAAADLKYRFIWDAPFEISPHDAKTIYTGSQYVHMSNDGERAGRRSAPTSRATTRASNRCRAACRRTTLASNTRT